MYVIYCKCVNISHFLEGEVYIDLTDTKPQIVSPSNDLEQSLSRPRCLAIYCDIPSNLHISDIEQILHNQDLIYNTLSDKYMSPPYQT